MVLSLALGSSPHLPVSVCGTGTYGLASGFSRQRERGCFGTCVSLPVTPHGCGTADLPAMPRLTLGRARPTARSACPSVSPPRSCGFRWYRNLNLSSIAYGLRPRLRSRLTLSGRTFLRKPWIFGGQDSHLPYATHANILSCMQSTKTSVLASARIQCSSTNNTYMLFQSFGSKFSPVYLRRRATRLVSYYALFK